MDSAQIESSNVLIMYSKISGLQLKLNSSCDDNSVIILSTLFITWSYIFLLFAIFLAFSLFSIIYAIFCLNTNLAPFSLFYVNISFWTICVNSFFCKILWVLIFNNSYFHISSYILRISVRIVITLYQNNIISTKKTLNITDECLVWLGCYNSSDDCLYSGDFLIFSIM